MKHAKTPIITSTTILKWCSKVLERKSVRIWCRKKCPERWLPARQSADTHFAPQNTLQTHTLLVRTFCFSTHFDPWNSLLTWTLCPFEHFAPWNILLLCKMFSIRYFALWDTKSVLGSRVYLEAKCAEENIISGSKVCWGVKCSEEWSVSGSRVCSGVKWVLGSKVYQASLK